MKAQLLINMEEWWERIKRYKNKLIYLFYFYQFDLKIIKNILAAYRISINMFQKNKKKKNKNNNNITITKQHVVAWVKISLEKILRCDNFSN